MTTTPAGALGVGEPLTNESGWDEVPNDHMVLIDSDHTVTMREIS